VEDELIYPSSKPAVWSCRINLVSFNMWIDDRTQLPLIRDSLARTTHTDARLSQIPHAFQSRTIAPFVVAAPGYPDSADVRTRSSVISRNLEVFPLLYPDLSPSQYGTTRWIEEEFRLLLQQGIEIAGRLFTGHI